MTRGAVRPLRNKLLLLLAAPLLVALAFATGLPARIAGVGSDPDLAERGGDIEESFERLMQQAARIADLALVTFPPPDEAIQNERPLAARLEGLAILDRDLEFLAWDGQPAEPPAAFADPGSTRWWIRLDGVRTRLIVRAGPDEEGWLALASFVIDSTLADQRYLDLVPAELQTALDLRVRFGDNEMQDALLAPDEVLAPEPENELSQLISLRAPSGLILAMARLEPARAERDAARMSAAGRALAGLLFGLLLALLVDWNRVGAVPRGVFLSLAAVGGVRLLLVLLDVPALLLPQELGSARIYGSLEAWGLLASPADFLLSAVALLLGALSVRACAGALAARSHGGALVLSAAGALGALAAVAGLTSSLTRSSSGPGLQGPELFGSPGRALLGIGLTLAAVGAAELVALLWTLARRRTPPPSGRTSRLPVVVTLLAVAAACSVFLQRAEERLALERLRSELAPQILEQHVRRANAVVAAVEHVLDAYAGAELEPRPSNPRQEYLAYEFWVSSELFHGGYKSSLDFYGPSGDLLSHFGYDLPLEPDDLSGGIDPESPVVIYYDERFDPVASLGEPLIHAEAPVLRHGELVGVVVGHVLDEPGNLSFLPGAHPYLAGLGPGAPQPLGDEFLGGPHYVLYNAQGEVLLSTLSRPPAQTEQLRLAAVAGTPVNVPAGDESFAGVVLGEEDRLHLLLIPHASLLQRLAAAVRLALLGLALLALLNLLPRVAREGGVASLLHGLRGFFHRKLLAALLLASIVPLLGLALLLRGYIEARGDNALNESAVQFVTAAQRVLEDYAAAETDAEGAGRINDGILYWLSRVVGHQIHVYENGELLASSKPELFRSGLLPRRLDGRVQRGLALGGRPSMVLETALGAQQIPVAYAPVRNNDTARQLVAAVPVVQGQRDIERGVDRVAELILLATVLLVGLLAVAATYLARTVARPVRELVEATGKIASGDYATRLETRSDDEIADLVRGFNSMASALASQRADLERRREYIETLLSHATTGVISIDPRGRIVTLNPAARALLPLKPASLAPGAELAAALEAVEPLAPLARLCDPRGGADGEPREIDLDLEDKPRRFRVVQVALPGPSGSPSGRLILLDDVTELMRSNQLAAWAEMARAIAHEIKNPLTPIQLSAEHLRRLLADRGVLPSAEIEACIETVIKQVRTLYDIAGEFSAYAKLPALELQPTDPVRFMRETIAPYRNAGMQDVELEERYEQARQVPIDARVLSRAVVNLVENALQAMPDGGRLVVGVEPRDGGEAVLLSVRDTGIGLDAEARKRLFEPYFSTKSSGTGLGLAIARRAVEAHQGTIEVVSRVGEGTLFRILLPAA